MWGPGVGASPLQRKGPQPLVRPELWPLPTGLCGRTRSPGAVPDRRRPRGTKMGRGGGLDKWRQGLDKVLGYGSACSQTEPTPNG